MNIYKNNKLLTNTKQAIEKIFVLIEKILSSNYFLYLIFGWFAVQTVYIAISTLYGIPPDEIHHLTHIQFIEQNGLSPFLSNQEGFYSLGEAVKTPFFIYHYLMSIPYHFVENSDYAVLALRFINIVISIFSLYIVFRLANYLKVSPVVRNLSLFMLVNTLMFVFLSASISYDNLYILVSLASIYYVIKLWDKPQLYDLLILVCIILCGLLIKVTYLPIAVVSVAILLYKYRKNPSVFVTNRKKFLNKKSLLLMVSLAFLSLVAIHRYGGNLINYGDYTPSCAEVHKLEQCRQNAIFRRSENLDNNTTPPTQSLYTYTAGWVHAMQIRSYGIYAHKTINPTELVSAGSIFLLLISCIAIIRYYNKKNEGMSLLLFIIVFYLLMLFYRNYSTYVNRGLFDLALQGRYTFAVLPIIYIVSNYYTLQFLKTSYARIIYYILVLTVFATAGLPSYIYRTDASWHTPSTVELNITIRDLLSRIKAVP